ARQGTIVIPYKYVNTIAKGMTANIEFEGYDAETYGVANGIITATSHIKGWRFQQAYRSSCHNKPIENRIFHKDAASKEEAKKAF
ncbi:MAG: hypothetical protein MR681_09755, partial [Prevotella sp.]|nr:hypothetical protein [Prevotella sp.]